MKKGKYAKGGVGAKALILVLTVALLVGVSVGGTLAWLTDTSDEVVNTFTDSDIEITLTETEREYKMIPGWTLEKDPVVTVLKDSEDCWVFIKVEENGGCSLVEDEDLPMPVVYTFDAFIDYDIDPDNWTELKKDAEGKDLNGIYYCKATDITTNRSIEVLLNNQVQVKNTVTKEMMDAFDLDGDGELSEEEKKSLPTLTFTAYAVQLWKTNESADDPTTTDVNEAQFTPAEAWAKAAAMSDTTSGT